MCVSFTTTVSMVAQDWTRKLDCKLWWMFTTNNSDKVPKSPLASLQNQFGEPIWLCNCSSSIGPFRELTMFPDLSNSLSGNIIIYNNQWWKMFFTSTPCLNPNRTLNATLTVLNPQSEKKKWLPVKMSSTLWGLNSIWSSQRHKYKSTNTHTYHRAIMESCSLLSLTLETVIKQVFQ